MAGLTFSDLHARHIAGIDLSKRFTAFAHTRAESGMPKILAGWPGISAFQRKTLIAIGGLIPQWPGRAQIWMASSVAARPRHYLQIMEAAHRLIDLAHNRGFARVEAYVRDDMTVGHHWIEEMGFTCEGVMRRFGPAGEDFRMYANIKEAA